MVKPNIMLNIFSNSSKSVALVFFLSIGILMHTQTVSESTMLSQPLCDAIGRGLLYTGKFIWNSEKIAKNWRRKKVNGLVNAAFLLLNISICCALCCQFVYSYATKCSTLIPGLLLTKKLIWIKKMPKIWRKKLWGFETVVIF